MFFLTINKFGKQINKTIGFAPILLSHIVTLNKQYFLRAAFTQMNGNILAGFGYFLKMK